jgi:hypothetical protein
VHKTVNRPGTINPEWPLERLKLQVIANSKMSLPLVFAVYHYNEYSSHKLYGEFMATLDEINESENKEFELKDPRGRP